MRKGKFDPISNKISILDEKWTFEDTDKKMLLNLSVWLILKVGVEFFEVKSLINNECEKKIGR